MGQGTTGKESERLVEEKLNKLGLRTEKSKELDNKGIDLLAHNPKTGNKVGIQVKGRGKTLDCNWRWFQIRRSKKKTWKEKLYSSDFIVLASLPHNELWVLTPKEVEDIINNTSHKYQNRKDNKGRIEAKQKEINLDIPFGDKDGKPAKEVYGKNKNNFQPLIDYLNKK